MLRLHIQNLQNEPHPLAAVPMRRIPLLSMIADHPGNELQNVHLEISGNLIGSYHTFVTSDQTSWCSLSSVGDVS